jgi:uncharacterized membrane protein
MSTTTNGKMFYNTLKKQLNHPQIEIILQSGIIEHGLSVYFKM